MNTPLIDGIRKHARSAWVDRFSKAFQGQLRNIRRFSGSPEELIRHAFQPRGGAWPIPISAVAPRTLLQRVTGSKRNVISEQAMRKLMPEAKRFLRGLPGWQGFTGEPSRWKMDPSKIYKDIMRGYGRGM